MGREPSARRAPADLIRPALYDEDYYLRGRETGKSLYEDYRWKPDLTLPMVEAIVQALGIGAGETVLDFGCARGYVVRAFRELGYRCAGIDVSEWAIEHCDPGVREFVRMGDRVHATFDWIIAKDVLEHIPDAELIATLDNLAEHARRGLFVVVPLSPGPGLPYVVPDYERDVTHVQRRDLAGWMDLMERPGYSVRGVYRVPGIKDNWAGWEQGNGFILARPECADGLGSDPADGIRARMEGIPCP